MIQHIYRLKHGSVKLVLRDNLENNYVLRITQVDSGPESNHVFFVVSGFQHRVKSGRFDLVGSGEIFDDTTGILSFVSMDAMERGRNVTGTFHWDHGVISGMLRREGTPAIHVAVTDISAPPEG